MASYLVHPITRTALAIKTLAAGVTGQLCLLNARNRVATTAPTTVLLPPLSGERECVIVEDATGTAGTNPITISGNGDTIDGAATLVLNTNGAIAALVFDDGEWKQVEPARLFGDVEPRVPFTRSTEASGGTGGGEASAATEADWFIDAVAGSDTNQGTTVGSPLQTHAELMRRLAGQTINPPINAGLFNVRTMTVHLLTSLPDTDPLNVELRLALDVAVFYEGRVATTVATGSFTAVTAKVPATNTPFALTDAALVGGWGPHLGQRVRITSGARQDAIMWVMKDLGAGAFRPSDPSIPQPLSNTFLHINVTPVIPQVGDPYAIETLVAVTPGRIIIEGGGLSTVSPPSTLTMVCFGQIDFRAPAGVTNSFQAMRFQASNILVDTFSCRFGPLVSFLGSQADFFLETSQNSMNDLYATGVFCNGATLSLLGGACSGARGVVGGRGSTIIRLMSDFALQACSIRGSNVHIHSASVFDCAVAANSPGGHAVLVGPYDTGPAGGVSAGSAGDMQVGTADSGNVRLWGAGNAGRGVEVCPNATMALPTASGLVTITGTAGDFDVGLAGGAAARAWDEGAGAYTAARAATWANFYATIAAGGFGGGVHNVQRNAHIVDGIA